MAEFLKDWYRSFIPALMFVGSAVVTALVLMAIAIGGGILAATYGWIVVPVLILVLVVAAAAIFSAVDAWGW